MDFLKSKKGIVTHPVVLFLIGVVLGLVVAWFWITQTKIPNPFC